MLANSVVIRILRRMKVNESKFLNLDSPQVSITAFDQLIEYLHVLENRDTAEIGRLLDIGKSTVYQSLRKTKTISSLDEVTRL